MTATCRAVRYRATVCGIADVRPQSMFRPSKTHSPLSIAPPPSRCPQLEPPFCLEHHPWVSSPKAPPSALCA